MSRNRTWAEKKPSASKVLGVFGLNYLSTEDDLWKIFGQYGEIEKVALPLKRGELENKGFGFITFNTQEEAARAKECLDGTGEQNDTFTNNSFLIILLQCWLIDGSALITLSPAAVIRPPRVATVAGKKRVIVSLRYLL